MSVGQALDRHVVVCGTECSLVVSHVSKSVWIAGGEFGGSRVTSKGASANAAVLAWKRDIEAVHKVPAGPLPPPPKPRKRASGPMTPYPLAPKGQAAVEDQPRTGTRTLRYLARRKRSW